MKTIFNFSIGAFLILITVQPGFASNPESKSCCSDSNVNASQSVMLDRIQQESDIVVTHSMRIGLLAKQKLEAKKQEQSFLDRIQEETESISILKPVFQLVIKVEHLNSANGH